MADYLDPRDYQAQRMSSLLTTGNVVPLDAGPVSRLAELLRGVRDSAPGGVTLNPVSGVHNALAALIGTIPDSVESYATGTRDPFRTQQQTMLPVMDRRDATMAMDLANVAGGANALQQAAGRAVTSAGARYLPQAMAVRDALSAGPLGVSPTTEKLISLLSGADRGQAAAQAVPMDMLRKVPDIFPLSESGRAESLARARQEVAAGVTRPVEVTLDALGGPRVTDGRHLRAAAEEAGLDSLPITAIVGDRRLTGARADNALMRALGGERAAPGTGVYPRKVYDSPQFKQWFADSQVVGPDGMPLEVYHGTNDRFTAFDPNKTQDSLLWFTSNKAKLLNGESGAAGTKNVMPVHLSAKKLAGWDEYDRMTIDQMIRDGFDGLKLDDDYIVFSPNQVKSAVRNRGTFDPKDNDIYR